MPNTRGAIVVLAVLSAGALAQEESATPAEAEPAGAGPPAAAASAVSAVSAAGASETPDEDLAREIVITGSRIPRVDLTTASPVTVIGRDRIDSSGRPFVGDLLQTIPEQSNGRNSQFNDSGDGSTRVNLRGLGLSRTLVLLNGRRLVAGSPGPDASVDLSAIPTAAIQRIEILKDGASAVYGSDAISGVVNIITRRDFAGAEAYAYAGTSSRGDGTLVDVGGTTGLVAENGNILFSGGFARQQPVGAGNRAFSRYDQYYSFHTGQVFTLGSSSIPQGHLLRADLITGPGTQAWQDLRARYPNVRSFTLDKDTRQWRPYRAVGVEDAGGDQYNYRPENHLVTPRQRAHLFAAGEHRLGPHARAYFEAFSINRVSEQMLAPEPLFTDQQRVVISAGNPYNPFGVDIPRFRRRLVELGNRISRQDVNTLRLVTGIAGTVRPLSLDTNWSWDVSLNMTRNDATHLKRGSLQMSRLQDAIGPGFRDTIFGQYHCGTPGNSIPGCVPLNLFGGAADRTITQEMARYLSYDGIALGASQQLIVAANLSGELFRVMPNAHMAGFALGYEYRKEDGKYIPDPLTAKGDTTGNRDETTAGSFAVNEGYLELSVPVLGQMGETAPGRDLLELSLAARVASFTNSSTNLSYKAGFRLSPIQDVTLRGTYSTAFRAPTIDDLYSGNFDSYPSVRDPCSSPVPGSPRPQGTPLDNACDAAGVPDDFSDDRARFLARQGGNSKLKPETANIFTVGLVVEPRFLEDVSLALGYYDIDVRGSVSTIGAWSILQGCYPAVAGQAPRYCDRIRRDPTLGLITSIDDTRANVGGSHTSGLDIGLRYEPETPYGRLLFDVDAAWIGLFDTLFSGDKLVHGKGNYDLGIHPEWTGNAGIAWAVDPIRAGLRARLVGAFKECDDGSGYSGGGSCWVNPNDANARERTFRIVQPYYTVDANLSWILNTGLGASIISAGVNNVLNVEPSRVWNGLTASSDPSAYDYMGRYFYARVTHKFR